MTPKPGDYFITPPKGRNNWEDSEDTILDVVAERDGVWVVVYDDEGDPKQARIRWTGTCWTRI